MQNKAMKPVVVGKFRTLSEREAATRAYYQQLSPAERVGIPFQLRAMARKVSDPHSAGGEVQ